MNTLVEKDEKNKFEHYPKTELFSVVDIIGVPHPYCITPRHIHYASEHCGGMLNNNAIEMAEKDGGIMRDM